VSRSHASQIEAANSALIVNGDLGAIGEFFSPHYVAHLTDQDMTEGHEVVRRIVSAYRRAFRDVQIEVEILVKAKGRDERERASQSERFPAKTRTVLAALSSRTTRPAAAGANTSPLSRPRVRTQSGSASHKV
jgi:hypothetical protein